MSSNDLADFLSDGKVKTAFKLTCDGNIRAKHKPMQVSYRLPADQVKWIKDNMPKNANYGVSQLLAYAIKEVSLKLAEGDFDIDHL